LKFWPSTLASDAAPPAAEVFAASEPLVEAEVYGEFPYIGPLRSTRNRDEAPMAVGDMCMIRSEDQGLPFELAQVIAIEGPDRAIVHWWGPGRKNKAPFGKWHPLLRDGEPWLNPVKPTIHVLLYGFDLTAAGQIKVLDLKALHNRHSEGQAGFKFDVHALRASRGLVGFTFCPFSLATCYILLCLTCLYVPFPSCVRLHGMNRGREAGAEAEGGAGAGAEAEAEAMVSCLARHRVSGRLLTTGGAIIAVDLTTPSHLSPPQHHTRTG